MKKTTLLPIAFVIVLFSCSKKDETGKGPLLQKDPSVPENFGMKINLSAYGLPKFKGFQWGAAGQLYISMINHIVKANFNSNTLTNIFPNSGGLVIGLSGEKQKMLLVGSSNNVHGYYTYPVSAPGNIAPLVSLSQNEAGTLCIYNNHLLLGTSASISTPNSCVFPYDFWCSPYSTRVIKPYSFYYVNLQTNTSSFIDSSTSPVMFSPGGDKALLSGNFKLYEFDIATLQKTDSFANPGALNLQWTTGGLRAIRMNMGGGDIVIYNPKTGVIIDQFRPDAFLSSGDEQKIVWGPTERKLYYTGPCRNGSCSYAVWSFDLDSRQEKLLVSKTENDFNVFEELRVSPDDRLLVFRYINTLYLKTIN